MPRFLLIILLSIHFTAFASSPPKIISAEIGINGLTCSLCSQSVEYALKQLFFIDNVEMDLSETTAQIQFKSFGEIAPDQIAKAVQYAGFSLRYLHLNILFDQEENSCIEIASTQYFLLSPKEKILNGTHQIQVLHQDFLSRKVFKQWKDKLQPKKPNSCNNSLKAFYAVLQ